MEPARCGSKMPAVHQLIGPCKAEPSIPKGPKHLDMDIAGAFSRKLPEFPTSTQRNAVPSARRCARLVTPKKNIQIKVGTRTDGVMYTLMGWSMGANVLWSILPLLLHWYPCPILRGVERRNPLKPSKRAASRARQGRARRAGSPSLQRPTYAHRAVAESHRLLPWVQLRGPPHGVRRRKPSGGGVHLARRPVARKRRVVLLHHEHAGAHVPLPRGA